MYFDGRKYIWEEDDINYLKQNYLIKRTKDIAEYFGIGETTVKRKAEKVGLPPKTTENKLEFIFKMPVKELLIKYHHELKIPVSKMAEIFDVDRTAIYRLMKKYKVKARNQSEAIQLLWKQMSDEEKKRQIEAAHKKNKNLAKKGKHIFQKIWRNKREKMIELVKQNALKAVKNRKRNGMKGVTGPAHPNWNPDLTDEERKDQRKYYEYTVWRNEVFERDNYTCQLCGDDRGGNLVAHHLNSYHDNPELRTEVKNGITLCEDCHKRFHAEFGYGNNTKEQFDKFKIKHPAGCFFNTKEKSPA